MSELIELTIEEFFEKEMYKDVTFLIHNGKNYNEISNFKKRKIKKHGNYTIFFDYIKNNKREFKTLNLNKIIFIEKPTKNEIDDL